MQVNGRSRPNQTPPADQRRCPKRKYTADKSASDAMKSTLIGEESPHSGIANPSTFFSFSAENGKIRQG
jgi:hypothetical protein